MPTAEFHIGTLQVEVDASIRELARCQQVQHELNTAESKLSDMSGDQDVRLAEWDPPSERDTGQPSLRLVARSEHTVFSIPVQESSENALGVVVEDCPVKTYNRRTGETGEISAVPTESPLERAKAESPDKKDEQKENGRLEAARGRPSQALDETAKREETGPHSQSRGNSGSVAEQSSKGPASKVGPSKGASSKGASSKGASSKGASSKENTSRDNSPERGKEIVEMDPAEARSDILKRASVYPVDSARIGEVEIRGKALKSYVKAFAAEICGREVEYMKRVASVFDVRDFKNLPLSELEDALRCFENEEYLLKQERRLGEEEREAHGTGSDGILQ